MICAIVFGGYSALLLRESDCSPRPEAQGRYAESTLSSADAVAGLSEKFWGRNLGRKYPSCIKGEPQTPGSL
jgi:hypothetical protein